MQKSALLAALQQEIRRHDFSHFIDGPPSIAEGGKGVVVPGCPACKKRVNTMSQFLDHLADDCDACTAGSTFSRKGLAAALSRRFSIKYYGWRNRSNSCAG